VLFFNEPLIDFFRSLNNCNYIKLAQAVASLPRGDLCSDRADCSELVDALCGTSIERLDYRGDQVADLITRPKPSRLGALQ
jgi:hypothetical protein